MLPRQRAEIQFLPPVATVLRAIQRAPGERTLVVLGMDRRRGEILRRGVEVLPLRRRRCLCPMAPLVPPRTNCPPAHCPPTHRPCAHGQVRIESMSPYRASHGFYSAHSLTEQSATTAFDTMLVGGRRCEHICCMFTAYTRCSWRPQVRAVVLPVLVPILSLTITITATTTTTTAAAAAAAAAFLLLLPALAVRGHGGADGWRRARADGRRWRALRPADSL